jgi:hypothetical protein
MTENIQPFEYQKSTNLQEHNDIVNKINVIIDGTNDNADEIAIMKPQVNINTQGIAVLRANIDENTNQINLNTAQIGINTTDITAIENQIEGSFKELSVNTNASTVIMVFTKTDGSILSIPFPVVSTTQSGIMNSATYIGYIDLGNRVSALENRQSIYSVQFNSNTPSQTDILTVYTTTYPDAPNPPLNGTIVTDYARTLQYTYDATITTWIDTSQQAIPIATNSTLGIVKGSSMNGQIEVEIDGTMSVVGYDTVISAITNLESNTIQTLSIADAGESGITIQGKNSSLVSKSSVAIKNYSQATADTDNCVQTKEQIDADKTAIASKLDKNAGIENAGKFVKVGDDGEIQYVSLAVGDRQIGLIVNNNNYSVSSFDSTTYETKESINIVETDKEIISTLDINNKFVDCIITGKSISYEYGTNYFDCVKVPITAAEFNDLNIFSIDLSNTTYFGDFEVTFPYKSLVNVKPTSSSEYKNFVLSDTTTFNMTSKSDGSVVVNSFVNQQSTTIPLISFRGAVDIGFRRIYIA